MSEINQNFVNAVQVAPSLTVVSATSAVADVVKFPSQTVTITGTAAITTAAGFNYAEIGAPTYTDGSAVTITTAATVHVAGPPVAAGSVTLTNRDAVCIEGTWAQAAGTGRGIRTNLTFAPTTGTGTFRGLSVGYTVNQTGGANGAIDGLHVNATETALVGTNSLLTAQVGGATVLSLFSNGSTQSANLCLGPATASVASSVLRVDASKTVVSATSAVWDGVDGIAATLTFSGTTAVTTAGGVNLMTLRAPTITAAGAVAVTNASTLAVTGAPANTGSATITNAYALWVQSGASRIDSSLGIGVKPTVALHVSGSAAQQFTLASTTNQSTIFLQASGGAGSGSVVIFENSGQNDWIVGQDRAAAGKFKIGSNTTFGATDVISLNITSLASATSLTWDRFSLVANTLTLSGNTAITTAGGLNLATLNAPTISAGSALTVTNASTLAITGPPTGAGAGPATITNAYSVWVQAGNSRFVDIQSDLNSRASAQFDAVGTTALANVTGLTATLTAGASYMFEAVLWVTANVTGGSKYAIAGTATATAIIYDIVLLDEGTNAHTVVSRQTALAGSAGQAGTTSGLCRITGTITVNAAGTLTVQFAQNASSGTSSVLIGSRLRVQRVA